MSSSLQFDGKEFISARDAAKLVHYTSDYIGQLCRGGKIESKMIGRGWFVSKKDILKHKEQNAYQSTSKVFKSIPGEEEEESSSVKDSKKISTAPILPKIVSTSASRDSHILQSKNHPISTGKISSNFVYKEDLYPLNPELGRGSSQKVSGTSQKQIERSSRVKVVSGLSKISNPNPELMAKVGTLLLSGALVFGTFFLSQSGLLKTDYQKINNLVSGFAAETAFALNSLPTFFSGTVSKIPLYAKTGVAIVSNEVLSLYSEVGLAVANVAETSRQVLNSFSSDPGNFLASTGSDILNFAPRYFYQINSDPTAMLAVATNATPGVLGSVENFAMDVHNGINNLFSRTGKSIAGFLVSRPAVNEYFPILINLSQPRHLQ